MSYLIICQTCCLSINSRPVSPQSANVASRSEFEKIFSLETHYYVNRNSYSLWGYLTVFSCVNLMAIKKNNCKVFTFFSLSFKFFHLKGPRLVLQWRWSASSERVYVNLHIFSSTKRWRGKKKHPRVMFGCSPRRRWSVKTLLKYSASSHDSLTFRCSLAFLRGFT